jgi:hypothetical protein
MTCHHWKSKGWCRLGLECKFQHPASKKGIGGVESAPLRLSGSDISVLPSGDSNSSLPSGTSSSSLPNGSSSSSLPSGSSSSLPSGNSGSLPSQTVPTLMQPPLTIGMPWPIPQAAFFVLQPSA